MFSINNLASIWFGLSVLKAVESKKIFCVISVKGLTHVVQLIFPKSIIAAESVSKSWREIVSVSRIWEAFVKRKVRCFDFV